MLDLTKEKGITKRDIKEIAGIFQPWEKVQVTVSQME